MHSSFLTTKHGFILWRERYVMTKRSVFIPLIFVLLGGCGWTFDPAVMQAPVVERPAPYYIEQQRQHQRHEQWRREHERWNGRHHEWHERHRRPEYRDRERNKHNRGDGRAWEHEHDRWHSHHPEP